MTPLAICALWGHMLHPDIKRVFSTLQLFPGASIEVWQGIQEPQLFLWWVTSPEDEAYGALRKAIPQRTGGMERRLVTQLYISGGEDIARGNIANYVLRELETEALDDVVSLIKRQIEAVVSRPGCLGSILAADIDRPSHLLGVTYWDSTVSFEAYARWASTHPWREAIASLTRAVPLRLLMKRLRSVERSDNSDAQTKL